MEKISDELLMAYADGELSLDDRQHVDAYLATNADGQARVDAFVESGRVLAQLFDQPMREPVPARLLETVLGPFESDNSDRASTVVPFPGRPRPLLKKMQLADLVWPAVAACGLIVAGAIGWNFSQTPAQPAAGTMASHELQRVLEGTPSGTTQRLGTIAIKPLLTFLSQTGSFCRQYELEESSGQKNTGIGCRQKTGDWRIELETPSGSAGNSRGAIAPAGRAPSPAIDTTVDRLIKGDVLGPQEETSLITKRWKIDP